MHTGQDLLSAESHWRFTNLFTFWMLWLISEGNMHDASPAPIATRYIMSWRGFSLRNETRNQARLYVLRLFVFVVAEQACVIHPQHIFLMEQNEYKEEGIEWEAISFTNNKPILVRRYSLIFWPISQYVQKWWYDTRLMYLQQCYFSTISLDWHDFSVVFRTSFLQNQLASCLSWMSRVPSLR